LSMITTTETTMTVTIASDWRSSRDASFTIVR
jgi:hypothetical protein